jgi:(R,R)-butanediol dehydrogenase/meso-butanediol dehydrogenase/diacetyl reductase
MRAAVVKGKRLIGVEDVPTPSPRPGRILLKTKYCSICGSDLEYLDGSYEFGAWGRLRVGSILGHEFSAEVQALGEGVQGWSVGDRVTLGAAIQLGMRPCAQCYFCRRGLFNLCMGGSARKLLYELIEGGYGGLTGAMAEYFVMPAVALQRIPDNVSDEEATLIEPLSAGVGGIEAAKLRPGDTAVVIGAGKIGLMTMLCAKAAGASPVIVTDIVESRLSKALEIGADAVFDAKSVDVVSEVVKLTEAGPDVVFVCVRDGKVLNQAVDLVRRGGTIVLIGFVPPIEVNPGVWVVKQLTLVGTQGGSLTTSMNLVKNKQVNVRPLISEIMPLEEVQRGFDSIWRGDNLAVLLKP